jgi:hypothetical protein
VRAAVGVALLLFGASAAAATPWQLAIRLGVRSLDEGAPDVTPLEESLDSFRAEDRPIVEKLVVLLSRVPRGVRPRGRALIELVKLELDLMNRAPLDEDLQYFVIGNEADMAASLEDLDYPRPDLFDDMVRRARRMTAMHPDSSQAHEKLGLLLSDDASTWLESLSELGRCVELPRAAVVCQRMFADLADKYQGPRCAGADLHKIKFALVRDADAGEEAVRIDGYDYHVLRPVEAAFSEAVGLPRLQGETFRSSLSLRSVVRKSLSEVRGGYSGEDARLLVSIDGTPSALVAVDAIHRRTFEVALPVGALCHRVAKRNLAADLKAFRR